MLRSCFFVSVVLIACGCRYPSEAWTTTTRTPLMTAAVESTSRLAAIGVNPQEKKKKKTADSKKMYRAADDSREPAGVAALVFSRPRSIGASLRRSTRRANTVRRWVIRRRRRRRRRGVIELAEDSQLAMSELDIPDWACADEGERHRLASMKALLQDDFERLQDITVPSEDGTEVNVIKAFPDVYGDLRLLRFLRKDRMQDPVSAATRYRNFLDWRWESNVDEVRWQVGQNPFSPPAELDVMLKDLCPCDFDLKQGGGDDTVPALVYAGAWDSVALMRLVNQDKLTLSDFLLYWMHQFESLNLKLHQEMMKRKTMVYIDEICCLKGLCMRQFSPVFVSAILKPWIKMTQGNYPETTKRIIFLNPPKVISLIWNIVAPMASPGTVAKVQFKRDFAGSCMEYVHSQEQESPTLGYAHGT